jgi:retron-type reverse transcriptase
MVMEPIFEREFAEQSYGFRPGRRCQDAVRRVDELLKSGHVYVVEVDLRGYFDAIPHGRLMAEVEKHVADGRVLGLIEAFLKAGVMDEMKAWEVESGTRQGGVISPLLANIYLRGGGRDKGGRRVGEPTRWTGNWRKPDWKWCAMPTISSCCAARRSRPRKRWK